MVSPGETVAETVARGCLDGLVLLRNESSKIAENVRAYKQQQMGQKSLHAILSLVRLPIPPLSLV